MPVEKFWCIQNEKNIAHSKKNAYNNLAYNLSALQRRNMRSMIMRNEFMRRDKSWSHE